MENLSDKRKPTQEPVESGRHLTPLLKKDPNSLRLPNTYFVVGKRWVPPTALNQFINDILSLPQET